MTLKKEEDRIRLEEYVGTLDEICRWLANNGHGAAAKAVFAEFRMTPERERARRAKREKKRPKAVYQFEGEEYPDHRTCTCGKLEFCPQCEQTWFPWARSLRKGLA